MEREMERLRLHVNRMGEQLEEGAQIMERLQQRLRALRPPT
jgi:ribosomal protein S16